MSKKPKSREEYVKQCKQKLKKRNKKGKVLVSYVRERMPKDYGSDATREQIESVCSLFEKNPKMTLNNFSKLKWLSKKRKVGSKEIEKFFNTAKSLYISRKSQRIGVVVAYKKKGRAYIGWSLCNISAGDQFNRYIGIAKAVKNVFDLGPVEELNETLMSQKVLIVSNSVFKPVPHTLSDVFIDMMGKVKRHFGPKDEVVEV